MTEEQLRDVLARVVPDPPDSVTDPRPVVRAARLRRRTQVAGAVGVMALVAVAGVVGGRTLVGDDSSPQVAEDPGTTVDPYSAVPCPEKLPDNTGLPEMQEVVAVRYCPAPLNGFPAQPGPPDALVHGVGWFVDDVEALPNADPARCAAVDVLPTDSRLILELADGSLASMPTGMCQDTTADGRIVDAVGVTRAFVTALDAQREEFAYAHAETLPLDCDEAQTMGPARPGRDAIVAATWCGLGKALDDDALDLVAEAWNQAVITDEPCTSDASAGEPFVMARTDRGDILRFSTCPRDHLDYFAWDGELYRAPLDFEALRLSAS